MRRYLTALGHAALTRRTGSVRQLAGLSIESAGPDAQVGEVCEIALRGGQGVLRAEVVGLKDERLVMMPYGGLHGVGAGSSVRATGQMPQVRVGDALLGRIIDAFGEPLDGEPVPHTDHLRPLKAAPLNPMSRPRVNRVLETGIRAIDSMLTLGRGQRMGIFSGSGVGKSTLLGMIARTVEADINVIALIGERGREVRDFIEKQLGDDGLRRSVVVVATSDQPALARARAAYTATAIAEYFRDQGQHVLLTMDSVTRFAMAKREIGLAVGEPPTARGYTPSVFAELPELCERCGTADSGGTITALYTVLVEGDDFNEPISDMLRATLDGHIVLSRKLAQQGHFPAIDVLQSASRLVTELTTRDELNLIHGMFDALAAYEQNRQMIAMGAYRRGSNAQIDRALLLQPGLTGFLRQRDGDTTSRSEAIASLRALAAAAQDGSAHET